MAILSESLYGILQLTIHRPEKRNSLSSEMFDSLSQALISADSDDSIRVVLISGSETLFSAGADLDETFKTPDLIDRAMDNFFRILESFSKPIVAKVTGPCVGEAFAMLQYCDLIYCNTQALFSIPSIALARTPRFGVAHIITAAAGYAKAAEKILLSEPINAQEALSMRLVTAIIDDENLTSVVAAKTARLAVLPPEAIKATKSLMKLERSKYLLQARDVEERFYQERLCSSEAKEALRAFLEGRKPEFK